MASARTSIPDVATRTSTTLPFGTPHALIALNSLFVEATPYITPMALYFGSNRQGHSVSASFDLFRAPVTATGFAPPVLVDELNTVSNDGAPVVTGDDLTILFSPDRTGNEDIWTATRAQPTSGPPHARRLGQLEQRGRAHVHFGDGCRLYFQSTRPGGLGLSDLYLASRGP